MKNREFYREELLELAKENKVCEKFIRPKIFGSDHCFNRYCADCRIIFDYWLEEEYKEPAEPEVDWSKVEVDTPILVSEDKENWFTRHFAKFENNTVYAWENGATSWTNNNYLFWEYAKLAEEE